MVGAAAVDEALRKAGPKAVVVATVVGAASAWRVAGNRVAKAVAASAALKVGQKAVWRVVVKAVGKVEARAARVAAATADATRLPRKARVLLPPRR